MKEYFLALHGCDDSTYMNVKLVDREAELIAKIAEHSRKISAYTCQPRMEIKPMTDETRMWLDSDD